MFTIRVDKHYGINRFAAAAQDGTGQEMGLQMLADNRNDQLVGVCSRSAGVLLKCPLQRNEQLTINNNAYLTNIDFGIRTCNSSLSVNITCSDGRVIYRPLDFIQCNTQVTIEQLVLAVNVAVFNDTNFIVINTSVSAMSVKC